MIYVDYISSVNIVNNVAKFTGGTNYVKNIINLLSKESNEKICILIPNNTAMMNDFASMRNESIGILSVDCLENVDYKKVRVLFLPQVNGTVLRQAYRIKKKNKMLKIYGTLHDKQHNCFKYDVYNFYYFNSFSKKIKDVTKFYLKKFYFDINYSKWIGSIDKIFTVSNYSLQKLLNKNIKFISYYIQSDYSSARINNKKAINGDGNFALMVGAGRTEKNALRTIEAFCKYHIDNPDARLRLVLTGMSNDLMDLFIASGKIPRHIVEKYVINKGYVSYEELDELYHSSCFVVFTSKAEGFGLPVLEAVNRNKVVLASYKTSIPEVAGACMYYINPYSVESIKQGFMYLENKENRVRLEKYINEKKDILRKQIQIDEKLLIEEILSN